MNGRNINLAVVDDHELFRSGISTLVESLSPDFRIINESKNGEEFLRTIGTDFPDIVLLDINMPEMNGFELTAWINDNKPDVKILVLSMIDDHKSLVKMLNYGVNGFLNKDADPDELEKAIRSIHEQDYYFNAKFTKEMVSSSVARSGSVAKSSFSVSDTERRFLSLCSTEYTYREIAEILGITPKSVDKQREALFEKFAVKTRTGLVMKAAKFGFVKL